MNDVRIETLQYQNSFWKTRFNIVSKNYSNNPYKVMTLFKYLVKKHNMKVLSVNGDNGWEFKTLGLIAY